MPASRKLKIKVRSEPQSRHCELFFLSQSILTSLVFISCLLKFCLKCINTHRLHLSVLKIALNYSNVFLMQLHSACVHSVGSPALRHHVPGAIWQPRPCRKTSPFGPRLDGVYKIWVWRKSRASSMTGQIQTWHAGLNLQLGWACSDLPLLHAARCHTHIAAQKHPSHLLKKFRPHVSRSETSRDKVQTICNL